MGELASIGSLIQVLSYYGPFGIVVVLWFMDMRYMRKLHAETLEILNQHEKYMAETRRMYESNVKLVEGYQAIANDLKSIIIMNTEQMTRLTDSIQQNQYCPMLRVEKMKVEVGKNG